MWRAAVIVIAVIGLPFMGRWGIAALLLLAFALVLDLQTRLERAERRLDSKTEGRGFDPQSVEAPQGPDPRSSGPWRDR